MRQLFLWVSCVLFFAGCTPKVNDLASEHPIFAEIDLVNVNNDKVMVEINPGRFTSDQVKFYIPKTVPGTYSADDYGQYIENLTAYDYKGGQLAVSKSDANTWIINNAKNLDKITYWVNDTYDNEVTKEDPVFSPAGTNILKDKQYMLNLHGFVGYFEGLVENKYQLSIKAPKGIEGITTLNKTVTPKNMESNAYHTDIYTANRYFDIIDNPIMYSEPDNVSFRLNDIEVNLAVYSPNKVFSASKIKDGMEKMMRAQKAFLGSIDGTKKYDILLYLSTMDSTDAKGFGALEHHTSTVVVLPEAMPAEALNKTMTDVVSHEFFHIVTPLTIHSEEVHNFNYNTPKMSKHLWMYEGVTEYFANLFQVNQGLIDEDAFYERIVGKINGSKAFDDEMSFTEMSENVLSEPYEKNYANVYQKGALIGMCLDLIIRDQSNGEKGILWLMKELSNRYGKDKAFKDDEIIDEIVALTYPEVRTFFDTYVIGNTPIPYDDFLAKAGLKFAEAEVQTGFFLDGQTPFINADQTTKEVFFRSEIPQNSFFTNLGVQGKDIIKKVNGTDYNLDNIRNLIMESFGWKEGDDYSMTVLRDGKEVVLQGKITTPKLMKKSIIPSDNVSERTNKIRGQWLKG